MSAVLTLFTSVGLIPENIGGTVLGVLFSAAVVSTVISSVSNYLNNRKNAKIIAKKNETDADNDIITHYRDVAKDERAAKESAVALVERMLKVAESQVDSMQDTIDTLRETVEVLNNSIAVVSATNDVQAALIQDLTKDRDQVRTALRIAEQQLAEQVAYIKLAQAQTTPIHLPEV